MLRMVSFWSKCELPYITKASRTILITLVKETMPDFTRIVLTISSIDIFERRSLVKFSPFSFKMDDVEKSLTES